MEKAEEKKNDKKRMIKKVIGIVKSKKYASQKYTNPEISIIMASYNQEKYIEESIDSVMAQTFKDFELIVINDKSTDKTLDIAKKYANKDKRIRIVNNKQNMGFTKSLNEGLKSAKGKYIAILDPDDAALPHRLKLEHDYLEEHKSVFLIGGGVYFIDGNSVIIGEDYPVTGFNEIKEKLKSNNCFWHCTIMFRNEKNIRYRDKFKYSQDFELHTRLITDGKKIENLPIILSKYRIHQTSVSYSKRAIQDLFKKKIIELYNQRLKYGTDEYDNFNPEEILNFDVEKTADTDIIYSEIKTSWNTNDFKRTKKFSKKYIRQKGPFNKATAYYILSNLHPKMIYTIRNIKRKFRKKE